MLFNSLHFLVFFCFVTLSYYSLSKQGRWVLLLVASCYFYAAFIPSYLLILGVVILIDYFAALWIERSEGSRRKALLIISLVANVALLAFFKYFDFINQSVNSLLALLGWQSSVPLLGDWLPGVVLPIGLSFHTFQSMSYTIEVYRGKQVAERNFGVYSLYVLFYPQLVAGPIERPGHMLPQLNAFHAFDWPTVRMGLLRMAGGFVKKVVIADRLALMVDQAYFDVDKSSGTTMLLASVFYSIQIYCDFSGYSDIAIGAGQVMGIRMTENFRTPYLAASIGDFWRRWHISLSSWFRDYVYIPLGGNRLGATRTALNVLFVFGLSGLWHGANWKFVIWGALHGLYLVISQFIKPSAQPLPIQEDTSSAYQLKGIGGSVRHRINQVLTFGLVTLTWIFFRARTTDDAFVVLKKVFTLNPSVPAQTPLAPPELWLCAALIGLLLYENAWIKYVPRATTTAFWVLMPLLALACYFLGVFTSNQFIYFQF